MNEHLIHIRFETEYDSFSKAMTFQSDAEANIWITPRKGGF